MVRWGILGAARIARAVVPPLEASPRNRLLAVASRSAKRAQEAAREWGAPRSYGSYEDLLKDPEIDAVYNPLPNSLHTEWTVRALEAGKHVLCEKPLALTVEDVDRIADAAQQTGRVVAEAFMYRHHPQTAQVRELVRSGALGTPHLVRGAFTFRLDRPSDIRLDPSLGGGSLWDVGCYPVSYARTILAEEPTQAFAWQELGATGIDLTLAGQLRFPPGALLQFDCGFDAPLRAEIEIVGSDGSLRVPRPFKPGPTETLVLTRGNVSETLEVEGQELYLGEIEDLADAILLGRPPRIGLDDSRANTATLLALYRSAREGGPVTVAPPRD
jgi:predicted dehydrogenase